MASVKNASVVAAALAAGRHLNDQQCAAIHRIGFRPQIEGWIDFLPVVDGSHEVLFHAVHCIRRDAQNFPVVFDAQDNRSAIPIGKRADGIINILRNLGGRFLKLHLDVFAPLDQLEKLDFCHRSNSPPSMLDLYFLLYGIFQALSNPFL